MSDMGLEAPDADAAEQKQGVVPESGQDSGLAHPQELPLEANDADTAEQDQVLELDDEDYR